MAAGLRCRLLIQLLRHTLNFNHVANIENTFRPREEHAVLLYATLPRERLCPSGERTHVCVSICGIAHHASTCSHNGIDDEAPEDAVDRLQVVNTDVNHHGFWSIKRNDDDELAGIYGLRLTSNNPTPGGVIILIPA